MQLSNQPAYRQASHYVYQSNERSIAVYCRLSAQDVARVSNQSNEVVETLVSEVKTLSEQLEETQMEAQLAHSLKEDSLKLHQLTDEHEDLKQRYGKAGACIKQEPKPPRSDLIPRHCL